MSGDILRTLHAHLHCNTMDNGQHTETKISWWMNGWAKCECVHLCVVGCYPLSLTVIPTFNREAVMTSEALRMEPVDFPHRWRKGGSENGPWALRWALGHFFLYVLPCQLSRVPVFGVSKVYTTCKVWKWEYPSLHIWGKILKLHFCFGGHPWSCKSSPRPYHSCSVSKAW